MSAAGLIAAVRSTDAGSSVSATTGREQMQQMTYRLRGLLDHFVGGRDKIGRERKLERMGCTKIDNEIKF
jgi:hypothetical protein